MLEIDKIDINNSNLVHQALNEHGDIVYGIIADKFFFPVGFKGLDPKLRLMTFKSIMSIDKKN